MRRGKAAKPYRDNIKEIKAKVTSDLLPRLRQAGLALSDDVYGERIVSEGLCLAEISDFQGILPKAIAAGVPVCAITDDEIGETGPILEALQRNRKRFGELFDDAQGS